MLNEIVSPLLAWYEKEHRILPWRLSKNPYYIWISEIMLQQTRVEAVKPYFERFITAFPAIEDVANAPEDQLLKMWEGLGYYNRVRNIQKAAKIVVENHDGKLPTDYDELKKLPGIGNYTAGAVSSIAYNIPAPAVDGNVTRVISRIEERTEDIMKQSARTAVENALTDIMPKDKAGDFNQALMELGATVCVPNGAPNCKCCPVAAFCGAYSHGRIDELPVKAQKKPRKIEDRTVLLIQDGDRVAIHKRENKGLLAGLYEFPNFLKKMTEQEALDYVKGLNLVPLQIQKLENAKHIFSHIEWHMTGYAVKVAALDAVLPKDKENTEQNSNINLIEKKANTVDNNSIISCVDHREQADYEDNRKKNSCSLSEDLIFVDQRETENIYTIPAAFGAYTKYMNIRLGQEKYRQEES